uniref:Uncharacterized protein n=1 Tax=Rhizophora mucronata TaxID=61149 RepID=A0A2P2JTE5_RHIMU
MMVFNCSYKFIRSSVRCLVVLSLLDSSDCLSLYLLNLIIYFYLEGL